MTARYYFSDDNLDNLITLLSQKPTGVHQILIGTDKGKHTLPHLLSKVTAQDRGLAKWIVTKIEANELEIRAMKKVNDLPQGVNLTTYQGK